MVVLNLNLLMCIRSANALLDQPDMRPASLTHNIENLLSVNEQLQGDNEELEQLLAKEVTWQQDNDPIVEDLKAHNQNLRERIKELEEKVDRLKDINVTVESYMDDLLYELASIDERLGQVGDGWLGVSVEDDSEGVQVVRVADNSPASEVYRLSGGHLREIDGTEIRTTEQFTEVMSGRLPGERIELTYLTRGGLFTSRQVRTETVTLQRDPDS